ncbi:hypothetical protein IGI04_024863 [Brassica rapa subsp. trilocularis]|uniref:Uncharacterized protein n=1 Tax=Brassica rapa subsp. trilocularis TaxID=1813537 RepID=A0ABQ7MAF2_BRACM|nr:hypothetical protein IGI04_024863 [Brassica rapa subsp. trilocularis]
MAVFISELSLGSHCFIFSVGTKKRLNKHGFPLLGLEAFYMEFGGEHKPDSCIIRCWRKLVEILIVGDDYKSIRSSGASYFGSDTGSFGIRENEDFGFELVERVAELVERN